MSRKSNPISLRLGITQVWDSSFQIYGNLNKNYHIFLQKNIQIYQISKFIYRWFGFVIFHQSTEIYKNKTVVNFYYLHNNLEINLSKLNQISDFFFKLYNLQIILCYYSKSKWFSNIELISNYIQHLLVKNSNPTKILKDVYQFFITQLGTKRIINSTKGPIKAKLKGFKVSLVGRSDNSRNQMTKTISYNLGSLPLTSINNYVEFSNNEIHTKLGTCGLQIWLFYNIY